MKKILAFLLSLIIAYSPALVFASDLAPPKDYRADSIINDVKNSKYSSATGKNYTVGGVSSNNGTVSARVDQRVVVGGSSAEVKTKVSFPVDYKDLAKKATKIAGWSVGGVVVDQAFKKLMDGVDYVMDPKNNQIVKKPDPESEENKKYTSEHRYLISGLNIYVYSLNDVARVFHENLAKTHGSYTYTKFSKVNYTDTDGIGNYYVNYTYTKNEGGSGTQGAGAYKSSNPDYKPDHVPEPISPTPAEMEDAFYKWMINNPTSVTDPVTSYMYSPKSTQTGLAQPSSADPSFGPNEITDEMMDNYIRNRDLALNKPSSYEIKDSATTETDKTGSTTKTETKPDGSKTTTTTKTEKDPVTGETVTTVTETTVKPDGTTETKTSTEKTDVKAETKLPPACEYFATLCDWMNWTKEKPETDSEQVEIKDRDFDFSVFRKDRFNVSSQCPAPTSHQITVTGITTSFTFDLTPLCDVLTLAKPALVACSYLYAAYIIIGASRSG